MRLLIISCCAVAIVTGICPPSACGQTRSEQRRVLFRKKQRDAILNLRHELTDLSRTAHERGLEALARDLTRLSLELTTGDERKPLPRFAMLPVNPSLPETDRIFQNRIRKLRQDKAKELYSLARSALREARLPSLAYDINLDVLRIDPDHKLARAVLGQQLFLDPSRRDEPTYAGEWVSPFEASKRTGTKPEINHPRFGWIPVSSVARYENGERPWRTRWLSNEKEAEIRRDFQNAWEVTSEHFLVKTNTSLEEGVELSRKLEVYYEWFHGTFAAFFDTPDELQRRFDQAQVRRRRLQKPMLVHYYATREEYDQKTRNKVPPGLVTNGLYWQDDRTCYLFRNPDDPNLTTGFHEATHQILDLATRAERLTAARKLQRMLRSRSLSQWVLCRNSNFWLLEGIACYMESFQINDGVPSSGDPNYIRFVGATKRLLRDGFYVDLRTFSSLGKDQFRSHPNHTQLYTQGSGFAHFLLHYEDGLYRDAFIELLSRVYRPDLKDLAKDPSLEELTGVSFDVMDLQYRQHMENIAEQQALNKASAVRLP